MSDQTRESSWFRQIFENDKKIISCARIMALIGAFSAFFLIFYYLYQVHQGNAIRFRETEIIDLVLYLLVASLGGLALNKYMEKPTVYHITKCCKCECNQKSDENNPAKE